MITKISSTTNSPQVITFKANPLGFVSEKLGGRIARMGEGAADSFTRAIARVAHDEKMPMVEKALTADTKHTHIIGDGQGSVSYHSDGNVDKTTIHGSQDIEAPDDGQIGRAHV